MEADPEQAIPWTQLGSRVLTLEDADLLPQGDELQSQVMSGAEEGVGTGLKGRHFHRFERKHSAPVLRSTDTSAWLDEKTASSFAIAV